jgi:hypothetical protein
MRGHEGPPELPLSAWRRAGAPVLSLSIGRRCGAAVRWGIERRQVAASLLEADGTRHFLAEVEIALVDGAVQPMEYSGRRYIFSHTAVATGYRANVRQDLYVFRELADDG